MSRDALAYVPYGAYWSTPFARWQGSFSTLHALRFAAFAGKRALARRDVDPADIDFVALGLTVPQRGVFYGAPWFAGLLGAIGAGGPMIMQACATSVRCLQTAAAEVAAGGATLALAACADRVSNGPQLYHPNPAGPGGAGESENWVLDNFTRDPYADVAMIDTAENAARRFGVDRAEQDEITLARFTQYRDAGPAFRARFMDLPFDVPDGRFAKTVAVLEDDEGVHPATPEKVRALKPVREGGTVTYAGQTHPADGSAACLVTDRAWARDLSRAPIEVAILGFGQARAEPGFMPAAPVPASRRALDAAGLQIGAIDAVCSHNPFAVNDAIFARETGFDWRRMNRNGCSLVHGHPQAPTGLRGVIELIETLAIAGGGRGLFQGCAAGDTAMAVVIEVRDAGRG